MAIQLPHAPRTLLSALLAAALAWACVKIEDGPPKKADTALVSPTPDPAARRTETISAFPIPDSVPESRANEVELTMLRRELAVPVAGVAASALHDTYDELRGGTRPHQALDILAPRGTPVLSAASGRVLKLFTSKPGGLMVYAADSSERFILMYGHLDAYAPGLADGQTLRQGQQIGVVGTTGNAPVTTPHLHFAIARATRLKQWWTGTPVNPFPLLVR